MVRGLRASISMLALVGACGASGDVDTGQPIDAGAADVVVDADFGMIEYSGLVVVAPSTDGFTVVGASIVVGPVVPPEYEQGPCTVTESYLRDDAYAGDITVSSPNWNIIVPWNGEYYEQVWDFDATLVPGEGLSVAATGGEVAAFTASVEVVEPLQAILPDEDAVSRSAPLTIRWTAADARTTIHVVLRAPWGQVECVLSDELGEFTIPVDVMMHLREGPAVLAVGRNRRIRVPIYGTQIYFVSGHGGGGKDVEIVP